MTENRIVMIQRIKILFVVEEFAVNGAIMSLLALLKALPSNEYDVSLFAFSHRGCLMKNIPHHIKVLPQMLPYLIHRMPLKMSIKYAISKGRLDLAIYRFFVSVQRALKLNYHLWAFLPEIEGDYDIVCSYEDGFVASLINKKIKMGKKCCWIHIPYTKYPQLEFVNKALKETDFCVIVSKSVGEDLNKALGCESAPQYMVHNIVDADTCIKRSMEECEEPRKEGVRRIISVGRVTPAKGFDIICPTAILLKEQKLQFEWYVLGDGEDLQKFRQMAKEMHVEDCVHFIGNKPNPMPWVKSADMVVQPSTFESWGMTVSEALCLGKAVVTSDLPVFAEQITDGINGLMRPRKPVEMADAIEVVLRNDSLRFKLENNAKNYPFTRDFVLNEFENMLNHVLKKNKT